MPFFFGLPLFQSPPTLWKAHCWRPSIERSRIVRAVPDIENTISGSWKPTALLLIALLLAIRIDHTSERKSAILFNIMAEIPGMGIHHQMSRHKKRDMPERQDTGTLLYGGRNGIWHAETLSPLSLVSISLLRISLMIPLSLFPRPVPGVYPDLSSETCFS